MKQLIPITEKGYNRILSVLRKTKTREKLSSAVVRLLPDIFFVVYGYVLFYLFLDVFESGFAFSPCITLAESIAMPALCLFTSTVLRILFDRPRPYEALAITPLIHKDTSGRSFPSNHTASAFVLSITTLHLSPVLFSVMLVLAFLTGLSRLAAGLHWPEDVIAGALLGTFFGVLQFLIF